MSKHALLAIGSITLMALAGCGSDDAPDATPQLDVTGTDYDLDISTASGAGNTELVFTNDGAEDHHLQLLRVGDGTTAADAAAAIEAGDLSVLGQGTLVGGPGAIAPGSTLTATIDLAAGDYVMFCQIPSLATGEAHSELGMVATFAVPDGDTASAAPEADATITITDAGYELPAGFDGNGSLRVVNAGSAPAEATIFRLTSGSTPDDVIGFLTGEPAGPPPFQTAGGVSSLSPGQEASVSVDLAAGDYAVLSFTPGRDGAPGFVTGLLAGFTVG